MLILRTDGLQIHLNEATGGDSPIALLTDERCDIVFALRSFFEWSYCAVKLVT